MWSDFSLKTNESHRPTNTTQTDFASDVRDSRLSVSIRNLAHGHEAPDQMVAVPSHAQGKCTGFYGDKILCKNLNFATRFSCQHFAAEDFVTLFMGKKSCQMGKMVCLGTVSTNLSKFLYAEEIQNLKCRRLEMATYLS